MANARVKHLRVNATRAETLLWHQLRRKRVGGLRFRRQFPLGPYVVDFVCLAAKLVVEVDGPTHALAERRDERRTRWLESRGFRVIRFKNEDVTCDLESTVRAIAAALREFAPSP
jgi:very-short-patch-repair endonuclease